MRLQSRTRYLAALVAGTLLAVPGSVEAHAAPAPDRPANLSPDNGSTATAGNPVFRWSPVHGAAKYRFQISPASDFAAKTYDVDTTQWTATPTTDQPPSSAGSPLYWRVAAVGATGTSGPWATARYVHT
ncbi:MAG: hypothetical protein QOI76_811, partial [Frankiales bacterium]|nr:hypothetical protein [Frankiales bacterium]